MNYKYTARFLPAGSTDLSTAYQTKETTFTSNNRNPTKNEQKNAEISLQKKMDDPYVARNYWELHDYLVTYKNPPWNSTTELRRKLNDFTSPNHKVRVENKDEKFFAINHEPSVDPEDLSEYIESRYNVSVGEEQIEEVTDTTTKIYLRWSIKE